LRVRTSVFAAGLNAGLRREEQIAEKKLALARAALPKKLQRGPPGRML
jgi:hypothetical protein